MFALELVIFTGTCDIFNKLFKAKFKKRFCGKILHSCCAFEQYFTTKPMKSDTNTGTSPKYGFTFVIQHITLE